MPSSYEVNMCKIMFFVHSFYPVSRQPLSLKRWYQSAKHHCIASPKGSTFQSSYLLSKTLKSRIISTGTDSILWAGYLSMYSDSLQKGRSEVESRWGQDFPPVQTDPGAHPASCKMGTGSSRG